MVPLVWDRTVLLRGNGNTLGQETHGQKSPRAAVDVERVGILSLRVGQGGEAPHVGGRAHSGLRKQATWERVEVAEEGEVQRHSGQ